MSTNREKFGEAVQDLLGKTKGEIEGTANEHVSWGTKLNQKEDSMNSLDDDIKNMGIPEELAKEAMTIYDKLEVKDLEQSEKVLEVLKQATENVTRRFEVLLTHTGDGLISDKTEGLDYWQRVSGVLSSMRASEEMRLAAEEMGSQGDVVRAYYESMEAHIPGNFSAVVEHLINDEVTPEDRELMVNMIMNCSANKKGLDILKESNRVMRVSTLTTILMNLERNPDERGKVLEMVLDKKGGPKMLVNLVIGGYVGRGEAESMIDKALKTETDPIRIKALIATKQFALGEKMVKVRKDMKKITDEFKKLPMVMGHKNYAKGLLTYKGIAGVLMMAVGSAGVILNIAANRGLGGFNRAALASAAAVLLGKNMIDGPGYLAKPGTSVSKIMSSKEDAEASEKSVRMKELHKSFLDNPREAELFYNLAAQIQTKLDDHRMAGKSVTTLDLKLEDLVDTSKLPSEYQNVDAEIFEGFAKTVFSEEVGDIAAEMNAARDDSKLVSGNWNPISNLNAALL